MADYSTIAVVVSSLVGSGGMLGAIYALLKIRPEAGQITVSAAQGAVIVQSGVIESLYKELERVSKELFDERKQKEDLEARLENTETELRKSRLRLSELEETVSLIKARTGVLEDTKRDK